MLIRIEDHKRRVDEQHRGVGRVRVRPRDGLLDAGSPTGGDDLAIRLGSDNACLVCGRRVRPSEVNARDLGETAPSQPLLPPAQPI